MRDGKAAELGRPDGRPENRKFKMQIKLGREHEDHPLLRRVPAPLFFFSFANDVNCIFVHATTSVPHVKFDPSFKSQIRELADEEMLHDVDVLFG
jgi:hypothetical protein